MVERKRGPQWVGGCVRGTIWPVFDPQPSNLDLLTYQTCCCKYKVGQKNRTYGYSFLPLLILPPPLLLPEQQGHRLKNLSFQFT